MYNNSNFMEKRLTRRKDSALGGVCSGLSDYTNVDVTIWRLLFVLGTLFTVFPFILTYLILWILIPLE